MSNDNGRKWTRDQVLGFIDHVEIEAVIAGSIQKMEFRKNKEGELINPSEIPNMLRALDPNVQFRDKFFTKGGGGNRDTKTARALVISAQSRNGGKYITITGHSADGEDVSVSVSKKKSDGWLADLDGLGKLSEKSVEKLRSALDGGKPATVIIPDAEQFGVNYWVSDDGAAFMDSMQAGPPTEGGGNG